MESAFFEVEAKLPWRTTRTDRSVNCDSSANGKDGLEIKFELNDKFTETLFIGVHDEVRYNHPDVRSADYNLRRLVFGFDFKGAGPVRLAKLLREDFTPRRATAL